MAFLFIKINFLMDATVGFIHINQDKRVSKLTAISVVFVPINIIGGMSVCLMMTADIPWPVSYGAFTLAMGALGSGTYRALRHFEPRKSQQTVGAR